MNNLPFDKPGTFWRGNLHTHSTLSDGLLSPEDVCQAYRESGYDFISLTDHFMQQYDYPIADTRSFRTDDFTTIIGSELHSGQTELGQLWHILAVGLPLDFAVPSAEETGPEIAKRALDAGAYVAAAHPYWHVLTENDVLSLGNIHAIEIYNGITADHNDRADSCYMLDVMLARGKKHNACATDDAHFKSELQDFMIGWVWVKSETLSPESLVESLRAGTYYSSTGPLIHDIQVYPGEKVEVRCSPAERIFMTGSGREALSVYGNGVREAEFDLNNWNSPYARITVRDNRGGRAWSNPFWF